MTTTHALSSHKTDTPLESVVPRVVLNVGCGPSNSIRIPSVFRMDPWREVRVDIDPEVGPDIVATITDLSVIRTSAIDAIWSSHNLEHLHGFEVPLALAEFKRILSPSGFLLISVPDLKAIASHIVDDALDVPLYNSAAGPIAPLDMLFGHQASVARGQLFMAHRTGFTASTLGNALVAAGFNEVRVHEGRRWDLWAVATMTDTAASVFEEMAGVMQ